MLLFSSELRLVACAVEGPDHSGPELPTGSRIRRHPQSVLLVTSRNPLTSKAVMTKTRNLILINSAAIRKRFAPARACFPWTRTYQLRSRPRAASLREAAAGLNAPGSLLYYTSPA